MEKLRNAGRTKKGRRSEMDQGTKGVRKNNGKKIRKERVDKEGRWINKTRAKTISGERRKRKEEAEVA